MNGGQTWTNFAGNSTLANFSAISNKCGLYANGTKRLETSTSGVTVTGTLAATAVTGDGSGLTNLPSSEPSYAGLLKHFCGC